MARIYVPQLTRDGVVVGAATATERSRARRVRARRARDGKLSLADYKWLRRYESERRLYSRQARPIDRVYRRQRAPQSPDRLARAIAAVVSGRRETEVGAVITGRDDRQDTWTVDVGAVIALPRTREHLPVEHPDIGRRYGVRIQIVDSQGRKVWKTAAPYREGDDDLLWDAVYDAVEDWGELYEAVSVAAVQVYS